jgi:hypothetical protein
VVRGLSTNGSNKSKGVFMKFLVSNYYTASVIHEVEADSEDEAIEKAKDLPDDHDQLVESLQYDDSVIVE